ncbi:hypothetical protein [Olleya sp. 1-3]|uniref:hypothetical protein n=1 Tax=Olleya sp. 1-3 TaxID=2058323 RepID=UPI000C342F41|nr:hypothetical protein [Olleya sp. 1-3]PKG53488.1 hypothetical protein CXF54_01305 [Olleya sp. 1-3]
MKTGTISVIIALIGILFVIWFNIQTSELFLTELSKMQSGSGLSPTIVTSGKLNKLIAIGIGLLGLFLGIKSLRNRKRIGILGIFLSVFLIVLTFIPIWEYILSDSALDINFRN